MKSNHHLQQMLKQDSTAQGRRMMSMGREQPTTAEGQMVKAAATRLQKVPTRQEKSLPPVR